MSIKRKTKVTESFSMASMTDVIFLLLIFFLVTSTVIVPNAIKVTLPSATAQPATEPASARIIITPEGEYYLGLGKAPEIQLTIPDIEMELASWATQNPEGYVAIHADESVPYRDVVRTISAASSAKLRVVLATKITEEASSSITTR